MTPRHWGLSAISSAAVGLALAALPSHAQAEERHDRAADAPQGTITVEEAVGTALHRNRDIMAAQLRIEAADLDRIEASLYTNPSLAYAVGNLVVGKGNPGNAASGEAPVRPGFFEQPVQSIGVTQTLDVWAKRGTRVRVANKGIEIARLEATDAVRQVVHDVRSAFSEVVREQFERELSREMRDRYSDTVRLSRSRYSAGEISETELRKVELEGMKYQHRVLDAEMQLDLARERLAGLLAIGVHALPANAAPPTLPEIGGGVDAMVDRALLRRPDLLALREAKGMSEAMVARERREVLPDLTVGLGYTHSAFLASGDNPNTLGLNFSVPLPLFDRNQAGIGRAELEVRRVENDMARLSLQIKREVAEAARRAEWSRARVDLFEREGMLDRAAKALQVAERSYRAGAISLLELLEAERTYLETKADYLVARDERQRAIYDLLFAIGSESK